MVAVRNRNFRNAQQQWLDVTVNIQSPRAGIASTSFLVDCYQTGEYRWDC